VLKAILMASKYDDFWVKHLDEISNLIQEAKEKGVSGEMDVSGIKRYGERKSWYGTVIVSAEGTSGGEMAHARSLGRILFANGIIEEGKFRFVISSSLKLRVERVGSLFQPEVKSANHRISDILSSIPIEIWDGVVREEPEWRFMHEFFKNYGFGRFAVLMTVAGLNDFQLKGRAEVAYWPEISRLLKKNRVPKTPSELESILGEFYSKERLPRMKAKRMNRFLSSELAKWLWNAWSEEVAGNFLRIWYKLAATMNQSRDAKTIVFAMKCLGIALLMAGESDFRFERIPIPVDYRVREFTRRLGIEVRDDKDVRVFWGKVLEELKEEGLRINMIHLDSLIWQIGVLSKFEILDYFGKLGLKDVGEKIVEVIV